MVKLHIKRGDESQFLYETTVTIGIDELVEGIVVIYNGRLKVQRICSEIEMLADHGISLPPNMQGLTDDQWVDLKLKDEWADRCVPSGGYVFKKDALGRRNGMAPDDHMTEVLKKTVNEAKEIISKKRVDRDDVMTLGQVQEAIQILRGAVMIVYPMGLPPHDPIREEFENNEDLAGSQASLEVVEADKAALWWAGKEMVRGKTLGDFIGKNEKTKVVCKLQKKGQGAPAREPVVGEKEQKEMMAYYYRKQEELKKLTENANESEASMDSAWADNQSLRRQFQGLNNVQFMPGKRM